MRLIPPTEINGEMVEVIKETEIRANEKKWSCSLVGYVMGVKPYFARLLSFAIRSWNTRFEKKKIAGELLLFLLWL